MRLITETLADLDRRFATHAARQAARDTVVAPPATMDTAYLRGLPCVGVGGHIRGTMPGDSSFDLARANAEVDRSINARGRRRRTSRR